jgi:large subunit ribosomal protein L29
VKAEDLRTLDGEELTSRLKSSRRELYELRFKLAVGQLDNHRQIRQVRKDIARILTVVHARRLGEEVMEAPVGMDRPVEIESSVAVATAPAAEPETAAAEIADDADEVADDDAGTDEKETPENVETAAEESASAPASRKSSRSRGRKEGAE